MPISRSTTLTIEVQRPLGFINAAESNPDTTFRDKHPDNQDYHFSPSAVTMIVDHLSLSREKGKR